MCADLYTLSRLRRDFYPVWSLYAYVVPKDWEPDLLTDHPAPTFQSLLISHWHAEPPS